uniref:Uncharacterized protein n=1 Tax=Tetranychus urticae TaxID=32264 RepID=A0A158P555_TETUR
MCSGQITYRSQWKWQLNQTIDTKWTVWQVFHLHLLVLSLAFFGEQYKETLDGTTRNNVDLYYQKVTPTSYKRTIQFVDNLLMFWV